MSKKVKLILIVTVIILGIILICLGVIRVVRNSNNENTNQNEEVKIENRTNYIELEKIPLDYNFADMVEDKCYIVTNSNTVYHIEQLDKFIKNVEENVPDEIRIVNYTIEGQPILTNLEYTKDKFVLKNDTRRDGYATIEDKKITTTEYDASKYKLVKESTPNNVTNLKTYYQINLKCIETE